MLARSSTQKKQMARKPPTGEKYISQDWLNKACKFFEEDHRSEVMKGTHQVYREKIRTHEGINILCRQKIVLRTALCKLRVEAESEISWPFSLRSLFACRPPWILLPRQRYLLGCLCETCQNVSSLIKSLSQEVSTLQRGSGREKADLAGQALSASA